METEYIGNKTLQSVLDQLRAELTDYNQSLPVGKRPFNPRDITRLFSAMLIIPKDALAIQVGTYTPEQKEVVSMVLGSTVERVNFFLNDAVHQEPPAIKQLRELKIHLTSANVPVATAINLSHPGSYGGNSQASLTYSEDSIGCCNLFLPAGPRQGGFFSYWSYNSGYNDAHNGDVSSTRWWLDSSYRDGVQQQQCLQFVINCFQDIFEVMRSCFSGIGHCITGGVEHTGDALHGVGDTTQHLLHGTINSVFNVAGTVSSGIIEGVRGVGHVAGEVGSGIGHVAGEVGHGIGEVGQGIGEVAGAVADGAVHEVASLGLGCGRFITDSCLRDNDCLKLFGGAVVSIVGSVSKAITGDATGVTPAPTPSPTGESLPHLQGESASDITDILFGQHSQAVYFSLDIVVLLLVGLRVMADAAHAMQNIGVGVDSRQSKLRLVSISVGILLGAGLTKMIDVWSRSEGEDAISDVFGLHVMARMGMMGGATANYFVRKQEKQAFGYSSENMIPSARLLVLLNNLPEGKDPLWLADQLNDRFSDLDEGGRENCMGNMPHSFFGVRCNGNEQREFVKALHHEGPPEFIRRLQSTQCDQQEGNTFAYNIAL
jgi:hypothetical protein